MNKQELIETVGNFMKTAIEVIDEMNDGDRIKTPDLAAKVAERMNVDPDDIVAFMTFFSHNYDGVETTAGRSGGIYKGGKPVKNAKGKAKPRATGNAITDMLNGINEDDDNADTSTASSGLKLSDEDVVF